MIYLSFYQLVLFIVQLTKYSFLSSPPLSIISSWMMFLFLYSEAQRGKEKKTFRLGLFWAPSDVRKDPESRNTTRNGNKTHSRLACVKKVQKNKTKTKITQSEASGAGGIPAVSGDLFVCGSPRILLPAVSLACGWSWAWDSQIVLSCSQWILLRHVFFVCVSITVSMVRLH